MFRPTNSLTQNLHPNMDDKQQKLGVILNVIQFTRWNAGSPPWNETVLKELVNTYGDVFLNACQELTNMQLNNLENSDSGGSSKPRFSTIYYNIKPYAANFVGEVFETLKSCGNPEGPRGMCFTIKNNDMTTYKGQKIIADSGTGNALPLFLDLGFIKALKSANPQYFNEYIGYLKNNNIIDQALKKIITAYDPNFHYIRDKGIDELYKNYLTLIESNPKEGEKYSYLHGPLTALYQLEQSIKQLSITPGLTKNQ